MQSGVPMLQQDDQKQLVSHDAAGQSLQSAAYMLCRLPPMTFLVSTRPLQQLSSLAALSTLGRLRHSLQRRLASQHPLHPVSSTMPPPPQI
jgi:hypothetical protein